MAHHAIPKEIPVRYVNRSSTGTTILRLMVLVGVVSFFATLWRNPALAWKSYVVNWSYFASIAMGGVMVAVVTWIVKAKWNWSMRRIHQSFAAYLPIAFVLLIPMLLSLRGGLLPVDRDDGRRSDRAEEGGLPEHPLPGQPKSRGRAGPVQHGLRLRLPGAQAGSRADRADARTAEERADKGRRWWRERFTRGWVGQAWEEDQSYHRMTRMAPLLVIVYAIVMTIVVFDWAMSLEPHWFSTLFGGWYFMGAFWGGFAATAVLAVWLKRREPIFD